jgi:hypothetical protein
MSLGGRTPLTARGESLASHRDGRGASLARRDDREYREYLSEEQRRQRGCIARRMQPDFYHGLLAFLNLLTRDPARPGGYSSASCSTFQQIAVMDCAPLKRTKYQARFG